MNKDIKLVFQVAVVFIGTIVGAGLASGQEISHFFTSYGKWSFPALLIPLIIYLIIGSMVIKLSVKYNLSSYNDLMVLVSPGIMGKITGVFTTLYLISSSSIIMAGSGALFNQYFGLPTWTGCVFIAVIALITLLQNTQGLVEINSFIVPALTIIIITICVIYIKFSSDLSLNFAIGSSYKKNDFWFLSAILYGGFNIMGCSGVLTPLSSETKKTKHLIYGLFLGAIVLTVLSLIINFMLLVNIPYIYRYEIPLLYITDRFGKGFQIALLAVIFCEMFSTIVSDIFSISKSLHSAFKIKYNLSIFVVILFVIPISFFGFGNLISTLYPLFGALSMIFIFSTIRFYLKNMR